LISIWWEIQCTSTVNVFRRSSSRCLCYPICLFGFQSTLMPRGSFKTSLVIRDRNI
jgi:hypothetical protein